MILQALYDYYQRKINDPESGMAPEGFEWKEIPFIIVIDKEGNFVRLDKTSDDNHKKGKSLMVPKAKARSGSKSYETVCFLWDHLGYVLNEPKSDEEKDIEMAKNQHGSWLQLVNQLKDLFPERKDIFAIYQFYEKGQIECVKISPLWKECKSIPGCIFSFRIVDDNESICEKRDIYEEYLKKNEEKNNSLERTCLITGRKGAIAITHSSFNFGADKPKFVSFQKNSGYDSYGKQQGLNAPISQKAEFAYSSALSHLLRKGAKNKIQLSNTTLVFWSSQKNEIDGFLASLFGNNDDPDGGLEAIRQLYKCIFTGASIPNIDGEFFVLGLSANKARLVTKFWHHQKLKNVVDKLKLYFEDIAITEDSPRTLYNMLRSIALGQDLEKLPPKLIDDVIVSVFNGGVFPSSLLNQTVNRIRAEQSLDKDKKEKYKKWRVEENRISLLKAYLNRKQRIYNKKEKEIKVALDTTNTNEGYLLGRLFAVLEKLQEDAQPGINATIKDRYYGAASSTPITVFPQLLKLKVHHLAKLENQGFKIVIEKKIGEIMELLPPSMSSHMNLENQAKFAIGYYHQRQDLFKKKEVENN